MINSHVLSQEQFQSNQPIQIQLRIKIPKKYHQKPVISQLTSDYNLEINILAAILLGNGEEDGWFHLQVRGNYQQIFSAMNYLSELGSEIWY